MLPNEENQRLSEINKIKKEIFDAKDYVDIFNASNSIDKFIMKYRLSMGSPEYKYLYKLLKVQKLVVRSKSNDN